MASHPIRSEARAQPNGPRTPLKNAMQAALRRLGYEVRRYGLNHHEVSPGHSEAMRTFSSYTMVPPARQWSMLRAVEYVDRRGIPGAIVECGVWKGGLMMMAKATATRPREYYLYDTFSGMTEPADIDRTPSGTPAPTFYHDGWCSASLAEVQANFRRHGLADESVVFRPGRVEETLLTEKLPQSIAVLRLDTDWYASTKVELETLYPLLSRGGVLIVDDYGSWMGQARAVDEYFGDDAPLFTPIDWAARIAVKV